MIQQAAVPGVVRPAVRTSPAGRPPRLLGDWDPGLCETYLRESVRVYGGAAGVSISQMVGLIKSAMQLGY